MRPGRPGYSSAGQQLRWWRRHRGVSQLTLAHEVGVSPRHLSFVENDRSGVSSDLLDRLAAVLQLPLRAHNHLRAAAGFAPVSRESDLRDAELARARSALDVIIGNHAPYPAVVLDRRWDVVTAHTPMTAFLDLLLTPDEQAAAGAPNMMHLTYDPNGLRQYIVNWEETALAYIQWALRDLAQTGDPELYALVEEVRAHAPSAWLSPTFEAAQEPYLTIHFSKAELDARFFTVAATLGTPYDVTLQEIRLELFYPADEATEGLMRAMADGAGGSSGRGGGRPPDGTAT